MLWEAEAWAKRQKWPEYLEEKSFSDTQQTHGCKKVKYRKKYIRKIRSRDAANEGGKGSECDDIIFPGLPRISFAILVWQPCYTVEGVRGEEKTFFTFLEFFSGIEFSWNLVVVALLRFCITLSWISRDFCTFLPPSANSCCASSEGEIITIGVVVEANRRKREI
jgi:hypothetical protein